MNGFPTTNNGFRQESQASGIGVPSYRSSIKESGLETPPTEDNHTLPRRDPR